MQKNQQAPIGFHRLTIEERLDQIASMTELGQDEIQCLKKFGNLPEETANGMVENVIGVMGIPFGVATNLILDGKEMLVPMATEESSVIAAVCNASKQCRTSGGVTSSVSGSEMIAQIQLLGLSNPHYARQVLLEKKEIIRELCDATDPLLLENGGGFRDLEVRILETRGGTMVILHLIVDTQDAMGANAVNSMAESLAPKIEEWTGGRVNLRILSNLADRRLARARAVWNLEDLGGEQVRDDMLAASWFAEADPYRAATHNKGIMNGVSAVALVTGNDTRALEAGAHAYASRSGRYTSLSRWETDGTGNLVGSLEMPMAVGLIGGATRVHPIAKIALKILGVNKAEDLARVMAAVGLVQNYGALKALATTGIQKGHMALHSKNVAMMAGAVGVEVDLLAKRLVEIGKIRTDAAEEELRKIRNWKN
ncbi:MAG: hydroxymethylglutaryl-CoA reductase, degradative [Proteobacteria bacterium]|nr:hydroxymethylglutaryl-CoA reductase, degradative [Pseudomonadota bacterium]